MAEKKNHFNFKVSHPKPGLFTKEHPNFNDPLNPLKSIKPITMQLHIVQHRTQIQGWCPIWLPNFHKLLSPIRESASGFNKLPEEFISVIPALLNA